MSATHAAATVGTAVRGPLSFFAGKTTEPGSTILFTYASFYYCIFRLNSSTMSSWIEEHFGSTLTTKAGSADSVASLSKKKFVGIYFSAHWCPPCRAFTPNLGEVYDQIKETVGEDELEIVFVSSDSDDHSFQEYFGSMPWVSLPFEDRRAAQALSQKYGVRGIPSLIVLDGASGNVIDRDGRSTVATARGDVSKILARWG